MPLSFETGVIDDVVLIRCKGRITCGPEVDALQTEVNQHTKIKGTSVYSVKQVVLDLAETLYIDSSGLGALVRMLRVLHAHGGGLKLCRLSPAVQKILSLTNLKSLFPEYTSVEQAIEAFGHRPHFHADEIGSGKPRIVCVDRSPDLLAALYALLTHSGYEVLATCFIGEAATLVKATGPRMVICGATVMTVPAGRENIERLRQVGLNCQVLHLPADFHITEAGQAGQELLSRVRSLLAD